MKNKIPCEMIEDILPLYVESLTQKKTNQEIENHLANCEGCNEKYLHMKSDLSVDTHNDVKEIDYLKKIKRKNRVRVLIPVMIAAVLACTLFYVLIGNPVMAYRSFRLEQAVQSIEEKEVTLNEVVPFEWDTVYSFLPYVHSKEEIEKIIGFESGLIKESVNEGMLNLLFVKGDKVVCSICTYPANVGFDIEFGESVKCNEEAVFEVSRDGKIVVLKEKEAD